jgi:hypothetical protein
MSVKGELSETLLRQSQDRQKQTLNSIQNLQQMEKDLYNQLEQKAATGGDTVSQDTIINKINELSQIRINMFKELNDMYKDTQGRVSQTRIDLVDQMTVAGVVENELNNAKQNLSALSDDKTQKMRMVELNTYYSQKYKEYTKLMKLVIYFSVPILLLAILRKKDLVPRNIINIIIVGLIIIGGVVFIRKLMDLSSRSNMNFDEYDWGWKSSGQEPPILPYEKQKKSDSGDFSSMLGLGCIGEECCAEGTYYNKEKQLCEKKVEGFDTMDDTIQKSSLSYIEEVDSECPWKNKPTTVKPFSMTNENYVRV